MRIETYLTGKNVYFTALRQIKNIKWREGNRGADNQLHSMIPFCGRKTEKIGFSKILLLTSYGLVDTLNMINKNQPDRQNNKGIIQNSAQHRRFRCMYKGGERDGRAAGVTTTRPGLRRDLGASGPTPPPPGPPHEFQRESTKARSPSDHMKSYTEMNVKKSAQHKENLNPTTFKHLNALCEPWIQPESVRASSPTYAGKQTKKSSI